jgi:hypothetical protein
VKLHGVETNLHRMMLGVLGHRPIGRKQHQLLRALAAFGKIVQRRVLYLGEINDSQREAWCRVIEAFDASATLALHNVPIEMLFTVLQASRRSNRRSTLW